MAPSGSTRELSLKLQHRERSGSPATRRSRPACARSSRASVRSLAYRQGQLRLSRARAPRPPAAIRPPSTPSLGAMQMLEAGAAGAARRSSLQRTRRGAASRTSYDRDHMHVDASRQRRRGLAMLRLRCSAAAACGGRRARRRRLQTAPLPSASAAPVGGRELRTPEDRRARRQPDRGARAARDAGLSGAAPAEDRRRRLRVRGRQRRRLRRYVRRRRCGGSTGRSQGNVRILILALGANDGLRGLSGRPR